jgi:hypothetical protein
MAYNRQTAIDSIKRLAERQKNKKDVEFKSFSEKRREERERKIKLNKDTQKTMAKKLHITTTRAQATHNLEFSLKDSLKGSMTLRELGILNNQFYSESFDFKANEEMEDKILTALENKNLEYRMRRIDKDGTLLHWIASKF